MNLSLWAVLLAALGGVLLALGVLIGDPRYPRVLSALALALFAASAVLVFAVAGQG